MTSKLDSNSQSQAVEKFFEIIRNQPDTSAAVAAVTVLLETLTKDNESTLMKTQQHLKELASVITEHSYNFRLLSAVSACELFLKFIFSFDDQVKQGDNDISWKNTIIDRGQLFIANSIISRERAAEFGRPFIRNGATVLVHGFSRVVAKMLIKAAQISDFSIIVTEGCPGGEGLLLAQALKDAHVSITIILDSAVGRVIEKVDLVFVGAEAITESGGIINKIGTYLIAQSAAACHKPFYVVAESFKFARIFPLNQDDIEEKSVVCNKYSDDCKFEGLSDLPNCQFYGPAFDYTPPKFISLLFTDLGVLTPSAVSDELIKIYQL